MKIYIVTFGKLKAPGMREAADYYQRLARTFGHSIEEIELKPLAVSDKSAATRKKIQEKERDLLLEKLGTCLSSRGAFYLLDEKGKAQATSAWAALVESWKDQSIPEIALCIGSSLGFHSDLHAQARGLLSLGPQTLPHELARVVLCEQVYRALSVAAGYPYHNE